MSRRLTVAVVAIALLSGVYVVSPEAQVSLNGGLAKAGASVRRGFAWVTAANGSASAPSIAFAAFPTTGIYTEPSDTNSFYVTTAGTARLRVVGNAFTLATGSSLNWGSTGVSSADLSLGRAGAGLLNITDADGTPDLNFSVSGTPALSSCGDGALATGSSNTSGRVNATNATACTLTFSATFGGNSTDCFINNLTAARGFVSAASSTAFTVSTLTAGDDFSYFCVGR